MAGTQEGAIKVAAKRLGMTIEEYMAKRESGFKWCTGCKGWKPVDEFVTDITRGDKLSARCWRCQYKTKNSSRPGTRERRRMRKQGLYWCNGCQEWLPTTAYGSRYGYCLKCYAAIQRKRYEQNPDPFKSASRKRKRLSKPIPMHERKILIKMFGGKCAYCQQRKYRHWDHVVPLSAGGDSKFGNIAPACQRCNMSKHNKELFSWMSEKGFTPSSILLAYLNGRATASLYEYPPRKGRPGHLNQAAKLTKCQVPEIREKYASGQYSYPELAKEYNVCTATIGRVVRRETYGNQD